MRRALANSTILALAFGGATCVGLNVFAEDVLRVTGCSPDLAGAALRTSACALAIPAVLFCTRVLLSSDNRTRRRLFSSSCARGW